VTALPDLTLFILGICGTKNLTPSRLLDAPDHKLPFLTGIDRADTPDHAVNLVSFGEQKVGKIRTLLASIPVIKSALH
jgi:hypothetical protein